MIRYGYGDWVAVINTGKMIAFVVDDETGEPERFPDMHAIRSCKGDHILGDATWWGLNFKDHLVEDAEG